MKRKALTLLELIVSVAIMAVLFGLALGAVQKCRTAAERVVCMSNIRQLCLAQHQYMEATGDFPAWPKSREGLLPYVEDNTNVFRCPARNDRIDHTLPSGAVVNAASNYWVASSWLPYYNLQMALQWCDGYSNIPVVGHYGFIVMEVADIWDDTDVRLDETWLVEWRQAVTLAAENHQPPPKFLWWRQWLVHGGFMTGYLDGHVEFHKIGW